MGTKRDAVVKYVCQIFDAIDESKTNSNKFKAFVNKMSDKEFDVYMNKLKNKEVQLSIYLPNMKANISLDSLRTLAKQTGVKLFNKLWITDMTTGRRYLTNEEYLILKLPIRRQQQFLDKKLSVPESDSKIDTLTGQVVGDDKSVALSNPEIQILYSRGLEKTLVELIKVRGGDINAYGEFKRQLEETGTGEMNLIDMSSRTRSSVIASVYFTGAHIKNNI